MTGDLSLGGLGEYLFLLLLAAVGWGVVGTLAIGAFGPAPSGSAPV